MIATSLPCSLQQLRRTVPEHWNWNQTTSKPFTGEAWLEKSVKTEVCMFKQYDVILQELGCYKDAMRDMLTLLTHDSTNVGEL